jgi:hypothetical protein
MTWLPKARCWRLSRPEHRVGKCQNRMPATTSACAVRVRSVHEDDDRTCQNLSNRRAFSVVILANSPWALANSCGPIEPVENRLSRTALTVFQLRPAALHGIRTQSSRRLCIKGRMTSMVDSDSWARAATVSSYFRCWAKPNKAASLSSPLSLSDSTKRLAAVKS